MLHSLKAPEYIDSKLKYYSIRLNIYYKKFKFGNKNIVRYY